MKKIILNENFENNDSLEKYIKLESLPNLCFKNCLFENLFLPDYVFEKCIFQNCIINSIDLTRIFMNKCCFENCTISNSDFSFADINKTTFKNCKLIKLNLIASDFISCKFKKTYMFKNNLDNILISDVKIYKLNQWVHIDNFSVLEKNFNE